MLPLPKSAAFPLSSARQGPRRAACAGRFFERWHGAPAWSSPAELIGLRRHLDAHRGLSGAESDGRPWLAGELRQLGWRCVEGGWGRTGVGGRAGPWVRPLVALRWIMDGLPVGRAPVSGLCFLPAGVLMQPAGHDYHQRGASGWPGA